MDFVPPPPPLGWKGIYKPTKLTRKKKSKLHKFINRRSKTTPSSSDLMSKREIKSEINK